MSRGDLTPFSYAVLALVGPGGAGPHDIVVMMRRGAPYWAAAESHWYSEPKRLARLGYLAAEEAEGRTRARTVYRLTAQGKEALREWMREPTPFPKIQSEAPVRLLAADVAADDEALLASLLAMRVQLDTIAASLVDAEIRALELPHRARYLRLVHLLGRRIVDAHRLWLDDVEADLGAEGRK